MTQDDGNLILALVFGFAWGIYLFFKGFHEFRKYRLIADTPAIPVRSVPMGFVEIHGKAQGGQTVKSPVSHTPCFTYQVVIERWKTDSDNGGGWVHERTDVDGVNFYLADATGKILVSPRQAEFDLPHIAQREAKSGGGAKAGIGGATNEELLQYVTQAGVHRLTDLADRGLKAVGPLRTPALEQKRQAFMGLVQHSPGSPDFQQQMISLMAPGLKQRLESLGPQSDPQHERARQMALEAFQHPPGSPEFVEGVKLAMAESGAMVNNRFLTKLLAGSQGASSFFNAASGHYRLTEYCIVPEGSYQVSGTCVENPTPSDEHDRNLITKGQNEPTFLISSRPEKAMKSMLRRKAVLHILGGAALSVACLAFLLAKLGWF